MIINESTSKKLEELLELTLGQLNGGLINNSIANDMQKLGKRPLIQSKGVKQERTNAIGGPKGIINSATSDIKIYPGGKK